jgi:hypothetical protein
MEDDAPMKLLRWYRKLHMRGNFGGLSLLPFTQDISQLVAEFKSRSLLDYGCGKGLQYTEARAHEAWGLPIPRLYDPAVQEHDVLPRGKFDGVICTDVLEHVPEDELDAMLRQIAGYARQWVFFSVCCRPSKYVKLPDGRNVHVTIHPVEWWQAKLEQHIPKEIKLVLRETK